jgi:hypothetical protein
LSNSGIFSSEDLEQMLQWQQQLAMYNLQNADNIELLINQGWIILPNTIVWSNYDELFETIGAGLGNIINRYNLHGLIHRPPSGGGGTTTHSPDSVWEVPLQ